MNIHKQTYDPVEYAKQKQQEERKKLLTSSQKEARFACMLTQYLEPFCGSEIETFIGNPTKKAR